MQVPSLGSSPRPPVAPVFSQARVTSLDIEDRVVSTPGLPPHARPLPHIEDPREIMDMPVPRLLRPVILVHGLAQHADTWVNLKNFLTTDPDNKFGGLYSKKDEERFLLELREKPDSKVFALDISDNLAAPGDVAAELRRAVALICGFTGAKQVDVVTHSMGALVAREARSQGDPNIHHLVMVSPPNQGSYEANLGSGLYARYPRNRLGAMKALRLEYGLFGGVANERLHELNQSWAKDAREGDAIITGVGLPTPDRSWTGTSQGDGMVAAHRAWLGDTAFYVAEPNLLPAEDPNFRDFQEFRYNHLQIASEPEVYAKIGELLTSDPPPPPPPQPQEPFFWDVYDDFLPKSLLKDGPKEQMNLF